MIRKITTKKGETRYDVQVSINNPKTGKRFFKRGRTKTKFEAEELRIQLRQQLKTEISGRKVPEWTDLQKAYEENCLVNKAASTAHNEMSILNNHARPVLAGKIVDQISETDIREILNRVVANRSLSLKHNIRKCLSNVFNYAIESRHLSENPCRRIRLPKVPEPELNTLSGQDIKLFLQKAEDSGVEWFPIWAFAIHTGLRSGELIALRYKHIQENEGQLVLKVQANWTKKGGYTPYTKNKMMRTVPLNKEAQRIIALLRAANPDKCAPEDFILPQIPAWKSGDAAKDLRAFLSGCGLEAIRFHDLRGCFISQCLLNGVQPSVVMKLVGHADFKVMMRYVRHTGSEIIGVTEVLNFLGSKKKKR
jgi:integrase